MRNTKQEKIDYPYTDQWVFPIVMQNEHLCRQFLERLFPERKIRELRLHNDYSIITPEKVISVSATGRSVRLDVLFEDSDNIYDIEMQLRKYDSMPKRTRYYHSMMDASNLKQGEDFSKLKPQYVIFVCDFDPFGEGEPIYDFRMIFSKTGLYLDDKTYTIFMNTKAEESRIPKELKSYFRYINSGETDGRDVFINEIHERVKEVNKDPEWRGVLMTLKEEMEIIYKDKFDEIRAEATSLGMAEGKAQGIAEGKAQGIAEGKAEGKAEILASLVKDHILTLEEAKARLDDPSLLDEFMNK
ncbi:MAG: Rpn family recombination-promoting nuclease/putative transposase [Firmicutes bacterium]|nr:Rpn family recombination-promoting nuclease/putative transposase [Bacillota bacterium]